MGVPFTVETEGFDLPSGAGHLGLQGAPGALPSALGFESPLGSFKTKQPSLTEWLLCFGGDGGIRTLDLTDANRTLSQLSYAPITL